MGSAPESDENRALIRRFYEVVWGKSDVAAIDTFFADDFLNHDPGPHSPDREGFKQYVVYAQKAANYQPKVEDLISEGDRVVVRITARGRRTVKLLGITVANREVRDQGIVIWRVVGGKIVERWARWG